MKALLLRSILSVLALGLLAGAPVDAQQQTADADRVDRYKLYILDGDDTVVERDRMYLLDSQTGALYRRVGSGERWAHFARPHRIALFPSGGGWQEPEFTLSLASSADAEARLLLTNVSSGATYTRNPDSGEWIPFRRN